MKRNSDKNLFDPRYTELVRDCIEPLAKHYFRLKEIGLENIPHPNDGRPILFVANHAGRSFPWDAILLEYSIGNYWKEKLGVGIENKPRSLIEPRLSKYKRNFLFRIPNWWYRVGCVDATAGNFTRLLKQDKHVIIFPEGVPGIARDYKERYQLLTFPTPMLRLAQQFNARIVPVTIVGSEHFHPFARKTGITEKIASLLNLPLLHLSPFSVLLPILPWLFYAALPGAVTIHYGTPLEPKELENEEVDWKDSAEKLRQLLQTQLNQDITKYDKGLDLPSLLSSIMEGPEPFWNYLPMYWPHRFISHASKTAPELFPDLPNPYWFWLPFLGWLEPASMDENSTINQIAAEVTSSIRQFLLKPCN